MSVFEQSEAIKRLPDQFFAKLGKRVQQLVKEGHDVINLGQGNPDLPTSDHIVKALQEAAEDPITRKNYPFQRFMYLCRFQAFACFGEGVARVWWRVYGVCFNPDEAVALLFGSRIRLFAVSQCLWSPGGLG